MKDHGAASALAEQAAADITNALGDGHRVAVVIGSGWAPALDVLGTTTAAVATADITGFQPPSVAGHAGQISSLSLSSAGKALVFVGRTHLYEGHGVAAVAHQVRAAVAHGCDTVVLTNGAGAINTALSPGQAVLISDHINLTGKSPLSGPQFVDLTTVYDAELRSRCLAQRPDLT